MLLSENIEHTNRTYQIETKHLTSTYTDCNRLRLIDRSSLLKLFKRAVCEMETDPPEISELFFSYGGLTATVTVSTSRASIHTYPDQNACFIDLLRTMSAKSVHWIKHFAVI
jgi:S-adenosylmethionine/arginine decarboxylase-like enzyme